MILIAALTGPLPKLGVVVVAILAALAVLAGDRRARALAPLGALVLSPVLLLIEIWNSPQLRVVHRHPLYALVAAVIAVVVLVVVARVITRRPWLLAVLAMLALPFRVPIQSGGVTSNLLVPLYLVVAAGSLAWIVPVLRGAQPERSCAACRRSPWSSSSRTGAIILHGPHHSAQKSTTTGCSEPLIVSSNVASVSFVISDTPIPFRPVSPECRRVY